MSRAPASPVLDAGLQRERTSLAWTRTSLALVADGLLVLLRHAGAFPIHLAGALCALALVVSAASFVHAARRGRLVDRAPADVRPATTDVVLLSLGITVLALATTAALLVVG